MTVRGRNSVFPSAGIVLYNKTMSGAAFWWCFRDTAGDLPRPGISPASSLSGISAVRGTTTVPAGLPRVANAPVQPDVPVCLQRAGRAAARRARGSTFSAPSAELNLLN